MNTYRKIRLIIIGVILLGFLISKLIQAGHKTTHNSNTADTATTGSSSDNLSGTDAKMNAYIDFNNSMIDWHHFDRELDSVKQYNAELSNSHAKVTHVYVPSTISADDVAKLRKAVAMPASIPDVDPQAKAMLDAVAALQPTEEALGTYDKSKEYLSDGGEKAREMIPALLTQLTVVYKADNAFGNAISQRELHEDEASLNKLDKSSLHYLTLSDSLAARKILLAVKSSDGQQEAQQIDSLLPQLVTANTALGAYKVTETNTPQWDAGCRQYKSQMESFIGDARVLSDSLKRDPKSFPRDEKAIYDAKLGAAQITGQASQGDPPPLVEAALFKSYNESVSKLNSCER
jgi:hypothetical protein